MWQNYLFGIHWRHGDERYYDELCAESEEDAIAYFNDQKRDDVALIKVVLIGPDDGGVREKALPPDSPFDPLAARRRGDKDDNAR